MLCAEDEQSRTCWMTAFRLFKVGASPVNVVRVDQSVSLPPPTPLHVSNPSPPSSVAPQYGIVLYQSYNVPQQRKASLTPFSAPVVRLCSDITSSQ